MVLARWLELRHAGLFLPERPPIEALVGGSVLVFVLLLALGGVLARTVIEDWLL